MGRHDRAIAGHLAPARRVGARARRAAGATRRPGRAREAAARLADPATRVVITGQQAGLFGGPLFTLLKAMTAMRLAAEVERAHGVAVVPVFWIDAEDHDWAEVCGCTVLDQELSPRTIRLPICPAPATDRSRGSCSTTR